MLRAGQAARGYPAPHQSSRRKAGVPVQMGLGYDGKLFILAFDHRGSFQKKWFGLEGEPSPEDVERISDAKHLIFEGLLKAAEGGADPSVTGSLVDEQFGGSVPGQAKERGFRLAMPVEKSGQNEV